jgi:O-antigen ligase
LILWTAWFPVLWLIGVGGLYWVVAGLVSVLYLMGARPRGLAVLPLVVAGALILSSIIGTVYFGFIAERLISLFGNVLIWVALGAALTIKPLTEDLVRLSRSILGVALIQGMLTLVSVSIAPAKLPVPLLSPLASSLPSGFAAFARNNLYFESWLDGFAARSAGLNAQPTWAGAFAAVALLIALGAITTERRGWRVFAILAAIASLYSIQLSLSRSTWISLAVAAALMLLVLLRRASPMAFFTATALAIIALTIAAMTRLDEIQSWLDQTNAQRAGSAETRGAIYETTWDFVASLPIPILGFGIKPRETDLVASVATHSTYLGLVFRGGYIAVAVFAIMLVAILAASVRNTSVRAAAIAVLVIMWCIFEDLDPGHLVPLGLIWAVWSYRLASDRNAARDHSASRKSLARASQS